MVMGDGCECSIEKSGGVSEELALSVKANRWSGTAAGIVRAALQQPEGE